MAYFIPEHKTMFIHISKAGGTSVKNWLLKNFIANKVRQKHCTIDLVKKETNLKFDMHFTTVRNPFSRVHSWYWYHIQGGPKKNLPKQWTHWQHAKDIGFNEWIRTNSRSGGIKNSIWWNQVDFIDITLPHITCKIEMINKEFKEIQDYLDCYDPLPVSNKSSHNHYRNDYESDTKQIIAEHFKRDLDYFNYDF